MTTVSTSAALRVPPADPAEAVAFFTARLTFQADVSDVYASLASGEPGFVLVDSRSAAAWQQGHVPGALHLPTAEIPAKAGALLDPAVPVVTYCWGPGCDGATRAALALARLGYRVKEMIGGIEYWIREGFPVDTAAGLRRGAADPLTAPVSPVGPVAAMDSDAETDPAGPVAPVGGPAALVGMPVAAAGAETLPEVAPACGC